MCSCLLAVVLFRLWNWKPFLAVPLLALFFLVDGAYFAANLTKVPDGGWFPLLMGLIIFTFLTTWSKGRALMIDRMREGAMPIKVFIQSAATAATRVPGTAVFISQHHAVDQHRPRHGDAISRGKVVDEVRKNITSRSTITSSAQLIRGI